MKCQEGRICAHWAEKNLQQKRKKILLETWTTICQLVGSLLEKMILVKTMEDWKIVESFIFYSVSNKTSQYYANSIDKVKIIRFVWNERKNENCQNIQFLCKICRKFQSDRKFMWEWEYTVTRELGSKNVILPWGFHHTLFSVTLCLLVATEKLPARAVWRTICWSYLRTTCRSIVTIHFMNCCE
jgi:hypothetical protein